VTPFGLSLSKPFDKLWANGEHLMGPDNRMADDRAALR